MKLKNKLIISGSLTIAVITASSMVLKSNALDRYNEALTETKIVKTVNSKLKYQEGSLFIESDAVDYDNFKWKVLSKVEMLGNGNYSVSLTTKVFAVNVDTANKYSVWLNAKNSSLNMIADSVISFGNVHVDIRTQPILFNSGSGTINIPELAIIYDIKDKEKPELVIAALGDLKVNSNESGGSALFTEPRLKYTELGKNKSNYGFKIDKVSVGNLELSRGTTANISIQPSLNGTYDLESKITSESLGDIRGLDFVSQVKNISIEQILEFGTLMIGDWVNDSDLKNKNLSNLFEYAKNGGEISLEATGETVNKVSLNVNANLSFETIGREYITPNNAFSILDYTMLDANLALPFKLASEFIGPQWTANLIRDGIFILTDNQVQSVIKVRNMTAKINGYEYTL